MKDWVSKYEISVMKISQSNELRGICLGQTKSVVNMWITIDYIVIKLFLHL